CFLAKYESASRETNAGQHCCPQCTPAVPLDMEQGQQVIEHVGAHIVHDTLVNRSTEPCGLCLQATPLCRIYLKKAQGRKSGVKVDATCSKCPNLVKFFYGTAMKSTQSSPCSNVPLTCELCGIGAAAVWRYNMKYHLMNIHPTADLSQYEYLWNMSDNEKTGMKNIWKARKKVKGTNKKSKSSNLPPLTISEAHTSRLAYWYNLVYHSA
ncbi:hypothetical protein BT96DRAFT_813939, partial [Gymnopus androsaceus JB14]